MEILQKKLNIIKEFLIKNVDVKFITSDQDNKTIFELNVLL